MFNVISLGAGVQSSTMALMAACGEITPMPDFAVFADTQAEPKAVYEWLDWLEKQLPYPIHRTTKGNLGENVLKRRASGGPVAVLPAFTLSDSGKVGRVKMRSCTVDYKTRPLTKLVRQLCNIKRGQAEVTVSLWMGISLDEITRCKPHQEKWAKTRWPLIEMRMRRNNCLDWVESKGYPEPPRSACTFCPLHGPAEWRKLKENTPSEFHHAVDIERGLQGTTKSPIFLHRSCIPLDQVDFRSDFDKGQLPLWQDECEGMCGV